LRDEALNGEIFYTLREAQIVIESWRRHLRDRLFGFNDVFSLSVCSTNILQIVRAIDLLVAIQTEAMIEKSPRSDRGQRSFLLRNERIMIPRSRILLRDFRNYIRFTERRCGIIILDARSLCIRLLYERVFGTVEKDFEAQWRRRKFETSAFVAHDGVQFSVY